MSPAPSPSPARDEVRGVVPKLEQAFEEKKA